ncbi:alpha/beta fold hydrolase [Quadrisphaera sp. DSM 44207]|uniref:alpha/beta fold hydrolase n=1 Tax=Quadrisphaera sp. DSM 44207 TaxID=1881057 RepID=UPI00088AF85F|nr:alpha/beta hydrolase [Quadrisphaera sp. DSM 44207]SDQ08330.1 hypothetical protein SAMN05428996_0431 [Quadrisphaera sp. DSM 44207]
MGQVRTSDGIQLHHEEAGAGRPLVVLHGWTSSGRFLDRSARPGRARPRRHGERELFLAEMAECPPSARVAVMSDHTRADWRDLLPAIDLPTLVCVARQDAVFDWRGPAWVGEHVPGARTDFFEDSGHALLLDETERFDDVVTAFLREHPGPADDA